MSVEQDLLFEVRNQMILAQAILSGNYEDLDRFLARTEETLKGKRSGKEGIAIAIGASLVATRLLFNYLASIGAIIDYSRKLPKRLAHTPALHIIRSCINKFLLVDGIEFLKDLRNYSLHHKLPHVSFGMSKDMVNDTDEERKMPLTGIDSEVDFGLLGHELLKWDGWSAKARPYLKKNSVILLRPLLKTYNENSAKLLGELIKLAHGFLDQKDPRMSSLSIAY
jgi:hypothetical protein